MTEIDNLKDIINDLTLALEMWIEGYPFDEDHKVKQRILINRACFAIGKPRSVAELVSMLGIADKLDPEILENIQSNELCHQCDYTFCSIRDSCVRYKRKINND
jgi:hypothetical protein